MMLLIIYKWLIIGNRVGGVMYIFFYSYSFVWYSLKNIKVKNYVYNIYVIYV